MINVEIKKLNRKKDERGWLAELIRGEDVGHEEFGQLLITTALPGKTKGNHYHLRKKERYCLVQGNAILKLQDKDSGEYKEIEVSGEELCLIEIPLNVIHAITNIGKEEMVLIAYLNEAFDPADPDTFYAEFDSQK